MATKEVSIIYPEQSYLLMGIMFEVGNKLGTKYQEKHYQKATEIKLKELDVSYKREVPVNVEFDGENIGRFFLDFLIDDKIILEIKKIPRISKDDIKQVLRYLDATGMKLAIIVNFFHPRLEFKRVIRANS